MLNKDSGMQLATRQVDEVTIVDLTGDRFGYPDTVLFKQQMLQLVDQGHRFLALNLTDVALMDSFGIAVMISLLKRCKQSHGALTMFGLNDHVTRLMELTHMDRVLDIWLSEEQALAHLRPQLAAARRAG